MLQHYLTYLTLGNVTVSIRRQQEISETNHYAEDNCYHMLSDANVLCNRNELIGTGMLIKAAHILTFVTASVRHNICTYQL